MPDSVEALRKEVAALRSELDMLRTAVKQSQGSLVTVARLAEELDVHPRTVKRRCNRYGIPLRTATGAVRDDGSRETPYISRLEWQSRTSLPTRTVRGR